MNQLQFLSKLDSTSKMLVLTWSDTVAEIMWQKQKHTCISVCVYLYNIIYLSPCVYKYVAPIVYVMH